MSHTVESQALTARLTGKARNGVVYLRDFDQGVVETLGGKIIGKHYYTSIPGVDAPPGQPGIPVTFSYPEDEFKTSRLPYILVARDSVDPAMQRWHPGTHQYRVPAEGAVEKIVQRGPITLRGYDRMEEKQQAHPYDISYTIFVRARYRGRGDSHAHAMLKHAATTFPPYGVVYVRDSVGDIRSYFAAQEGIVSADELADIENRVAGFALTLRVEGELDFLEPHTFRTVSANPSIQLKAR